MGEEGLGDLRGMQAIVTRFNDAPMAYLVVEGMGLGTILNRGLGVERYKISVSTPGGHSWVDYGQPSAIHEICKLVNHLTSIYVPQNPCSTMNVGMINGGTSINTIAARAWLELDLRSEDGSTLARMVSDMHKACKQLQRGHVTVKVERIGKRLAGQLSLNHPLAVLAKNILRELGVEARFDIASTDANLPLSRGYPAICIGITQGNNAHTLEEYILTEPVRIGLEQLYLLVTRAWDTIP
jgi:acetylornithine deacetylase/succinyl-diaminopimelate desuccinylase-like protein